MYTTRRCHNNYRFELNSIVHALVPHLAFNNVNLGVTPISYCAHTGPCHSTKNYSLTFFVNFFDFIATDFFFMPASFYALLFCCSMLVKTMS